MDHVNITINGKKLSAKAGQTVLEAAADAGIDIPSLCHHPALKPYGACRVCLVEIEKQRTLQPACTFPVSEGMVVQTETPKVVESRVQSLQLIFSEGTHQCMFCPMSGNDNNSDCELQRLAYRYKISSWRFAPHYDRPRPLDASHRYFVMDHGRCILCRRCVRACDEISAGHTLGVHQRGSRTMICKDDDVAAAKSNCVSCGTCVQVCPTGALTDRFSAYRGHETEGKRAKATCIECPVGCGTEVLTRNNHIVRIDGDWEAHNAGLLCQRGRFGVLDAKPPRLLQPFIRGQDGLRPASFDQALSLVAKRLSESAHVAGLISPRMTSRLLAGFAYLFCEAIGSNEMSLLYGQAPPLEMGAVATLNQVVESDCIAIIGGDPLNEQRVVGYLVRRAFDRGAHVLVIHDHPTSLDNLAEQRMQLRSPIHQTTGPFAWLNLAYHLQLDGLSRLRAAVEAAQRPVVMYGPGLSSMLYAVLRALPAKVRYLPLVQGSNVIGATRLGLETRPVSGDAVYVVAGDDPLEGLAIPQTNFLVVQAAYSSQWTQAADVVLPGRTWSEKPGHVINIEGRKLASVPLLEPPAGVKSDLDTLLMLAERLGHPLNYDQISDICLAV